MAHDHHPHDHAHSPGAAHSHSAGHNHGSADHLGSHPHGPDRAADLQVLTAQFIDGFREARDKSAYLRIAAVPLEIADAAGGPALKLVDVELRTEWQVGTASPSFGSRELSYLPYPGEMVTERTNMGFVYVSLTTRRIWDLREFLSRRMETDA